MNKFKNIQISLLVFSTTVLITIILSLLFVDFTRHSFLAMNNGYYSFTIHSEDNSEVNLNSLNEYLTNHEDIVMVIHNLNSNAVYVYDKSLYYDTMISSGSYFMMDNFDTDTKVCLIDESAINHHLIDDNEVYIHGEWYNIIGTINKSHPLSFNYDSSFRKYEAYPIILPMSSIKNIQGYVYLYNLCKLEAREIASLVSSSQEYYSFEYNSSAVTIQNLISHSTFRNIILGLLLAIVILVVTYYMILLNRANEFSVHYLYGANKKELIKILIKDYAVLIAITSFIASNFALIINHISINYIPFLIIVYITSLVVNILVVVISFSIFKYKNILLGGLK